jgi:phosphatidylglycerophosphatase GEP4
MRERQYDTSGKDEVTTHTTEKQQDTSVSIETKGDLRILVIGDRMMTDTLLANRLSRLLPSVPVDAKQSTTSTANTKPIPSVLSIHSTLLLQPKDVRLLRWIEEKLSKGRVREDQTDWARYTYTIAPAPAAVVLSWKDRVNPFRDTAPLTWHPRSWRPAPLAVGLGTGLWAVGRYTGLGIYRLFSKALEGEVEVAKAMAERAATAKAEAKQVAEKAEIVESVLEGAKR